MHGVFVAPGAAASSQVTGGSPGCVRGTPYSVQDFSSRSGPSPKFTLAANWSLEG